MLTFIIWAIGSWYTARSVSNGWHLLWVVPVLAVVSGLLAAGVNIQLLGDPPGEAVLSGISTFSFGILGGGFIAALTFWKRRRREKREAKEFEAQTNSAPLIDTHADRQR